MSAYRFFPLRQGLGASLPVEAWIRDNHDPQTKAVLGFNLRPHELPGGQPFAFCSRVAEAGALANLGSTRPRVHACPARVGQMPDAQPCAVFIVPCQHLMWWA